jgi:hypothetical protein
VIAPDDLREVPFHITTCPATALLICRRTGLLRSKLDEMTVEAADYTYFTTIAKPEPLN